MDTALLMLGSFVLMAVILIASINPKGKSENPDSITTPGNLIVEMYWDDKSNSDVDLWVQAPGDRPVGYSNQSGKYFNLLRDDLGFMSDISGKNYEMAFTRGLPEGEYIINVHLYRAGDVLPEAVKIVARTRSADGRVYDVGTAQVVLTRAGEEITALRITFDSRGVVKGINHLPKMLRSSVL